MLHRLSALLALTVLTCALPTNAQTLTAMGTTTNNSSGHNNSSQAIFSLTGDNLTIQLCNTTPNPGTQSVADGVGAIYVGFNGFNSSSAALTSVTAARVHNTNDNNSTFQNNQNVTGEFKLEQYSPAFSKNSALYNLAVGSIGNSGFGSGGINGSGIGGPDYLIAATGTDYVSHQDLEGHTLIDGCASMTLSGFSGLNLQTGINSVMFTYGTAPEGYTTTTQLTYTGGGGGGNPSVPEPGPVAMFTAAGLAGVWIVRKRTQAAKTA
jgi:hypothetical protein